MIKVLQVLYKAQFGGAEVNTQILIQHTDTTKYDVRACFLHQPGPMAALYRANGINTTVIGMKHGSDIAGVFRFWRFLKKEKFDIVHIQLPNLLTLVVAYLSVPHVVCHIRWGKASQRSGLRKKLFGFLFRRIDAVITVCNFIKHIIVNEYGVPAKQVHTIYNGIDLATYSQTGDRFEILSELGIDKPPSFIVGFVGRLIALKGCHKLLHAMREIILADPGCYLVLVGDGPEQEPLKQLAQKLNIYDNVIFAGARDDVARILQVFDVFVLPSDIEAFPRSAQEALAAGVPVVASNIAGIPEIIRDGQEGYLIPHQDIDMFREKISYLKNNPDVRRGMQQAALKRITDFSIQATIAQVDDLYIQITAQ